MRLGLIIKEYRDKNKISMEDFAKRSGISKAYVGLLEKGKHPKTGKPIMPSIDIIRKASVGLMMDFDTLFNMLDEEITLNDSIEFTIPSSSLRSDEQELLEGYNKLDSGDKGEVRGLIKGMLRSEKYSDNSKKKNA